VSLEEFRPRPASKRMIPTAIETIAEIRFLTQQGVGIEGADGAGTEPEREQQQDRREPKHLGDQRCR